ncbi:hypothetical protein AB0E96_35705 [Kitasatospora sp. NPDC036755]|uniref:hypothetical protein n=1 Tax=Kitasatospora sp. NPDC036755 TaxID=3154600 RepID=UPI0033E377E1
MRIARWTVAAATAALFAAAPATALAAPAEGASAVAPTITATTVAWDAAYGTEASASGTRWAEQKPSGFGADLVLTGTLTTTGTGCYAVWTQFTNDFSAGPTKKQAEVCGAGTVAVNARQSYSLTTTGSIAICKAGTTYPSDCGEWKSITHWPIGG